MRFLKITLNFPPSVPPSKIDVSRSKASHIQKHTQECSLDFKSTGLQHDFWLLAVHRPVALSRPCLVPATPHLLSISANRHPTVPPPKRSIWVPSGYLYTLSCELLDRAPRAHSKIG
jgi:hypothetical protein